ncbi:MAG: hypothetical protein M3Y28_01145 [Armatimonadota bacterium]|nr:hypothetical protein [Armatimonadota bacterium]
MKLERARELYSDYAEGALSPAFTQALEQHFEADPEARADFDQFLQVYSLLDAPEARAEVEVPLGFRAKVLELAAQEQARREAAPTRRAALTLTGWFSSWGHRRQATGGLLAAFVVAALAGVIIHGVNTGSESGTVESGLGGHLSALTTTTIRGVTSDTQADGSVRHLFQIHLPTKIPQANLTAYVVTATDQITDEAARLHDATPALSQPITLSNTQTMQIPVTLLQSPTAGHTLNLFVSWTPTDPTLPTGRQIVFTPVGPVGPSDATPDPTGTHYYDALQSIAASYGVTVISDASAANVPVTAPAPNEDAQTALNDIARQLDDHHAVASLGDNTYQIYTQ